MAKQILEICPPEAIWRKRGFKLSTGWSRARWRLFESSDQLCSNWLKLIIACDARGVFKIEALGKADIKVRTKLV
jgi:hypothetical protein